MVPRMSRRRFTSAAAAAMLPSISRAASSLQEVGRKFTADGSALPFRGSTIIIPLNRTGAAYDLLVRLREALAQSPLAPHLALLPSASFHMTVFEVVNDHDRAPADWPDDMPGSATIDAVSDHAAKALRNASFVYSQPVVMRPLDVHITTHGVALRVTGHDNGQTDALRALRNQIAERLDIHRPTHAAYGFHMTLAYVVGAVDDGAIMETAARLEAITRPKVEEACALPLGAPMFCRYETMMAFQPIFTLPRVS